MKVLGAILAGGQSRRFGQDKAEAIIDGVPMLDHVTAILSKQVDQLVICGRNWRDIERVDDRPKAGMGPLGGLNGALAYASDHAFDAVITVPVDVLPLPANLVELLSGTEPAVFAEQHLIGYWPAHLSGTLDTYLASAGNGAFHLWLDHVAVRKIAEPLPLHNVNSPDDLKRLLDDE
ncbi:MAG: molybdenum cofactor guanylyltransferase [Parvibaculum sp.]|nr:molybdenum cofactor guanylyltransferase [Parvibaculum sp.]